MQSWSFATSISNSVFKYKEQKWIKVKSFNSGLLSNLCVTIKSFYPPGVGFLIYECGPKQLPSSHLNFSEIWDSGCESTILTFNITESSKASFALFFPQPPPPLRCSSSVIFPSLKPSLKLLSVHITHHLVTIWSQLRHSMRPQTLSQPSFSFPFFSILQIVTKGFGVCFCFFFFFFFFEHILCICRSQELEIKRWQ